MSGAAFAALLMEDGKWLAPNFIGKGSATLGAVSTWTFTTTNAIPAGATVVIGTHQNSSGPTVTVTSISDGTNTYSTFAVNNFTPAVITITRVSLLYKASGVAAVAAGATITVTFNAATGGGSAMCIMAWIPGGAYNVSDTTATASAFSVATGTLAKAVEIVFGYSISFGTAATAETSSGSGFTNVGNDSQTLNTQPWGHALDYSVTAVTTTVTYAPSYSNNSSPAALVASFY